MHSHQAHSDTHAYHKPGGRLPLLSARPAVTFPAIERHRPQASTKLYCLVTEAHRCEKLAQSFYAVVPGRDSNPRPLGRESDTLPQHHDATYQLNTRLCKSSHFHDTQLYLKRRALNDNGFLLVHADNSSGMTQQLQAVLKECRLDRHKLFKLLERDGFLQQLVTGVMRKMSHDKLSWIRHEVILIQLIADNISRHLPVNRIT